MIGRENECLQLDKILKSPKARFLALYGRRRIGKTFLIKQFFEAKTHFVSVTGLKDGNLNDQLTIFTKAYAKTFLNNQAIPCFETWYQAFEALTQRLDSLKPGKKCVLFLDELPWLASKRGKLLPMLDHFWNTHWSQKSNFILITCGSAASWMIEKLIGAKGGLHNRLTDTIALQPFTLKETVSYFKQTGFRLKPEQALQAYMIVGGVPYYLEQLQKSQSLSQNIDRLCFASDGLLHREFLNLFPALFTKPENYIRIIRCIADHHYGITREALLSKLDIHSGGEFNKRIFALEAAGFIQKHIPFGRKKTYHYRVVDEYVLFYLKWIEPFKLAGGVAPYWSTTSNTPAYHSWSGFAFENICYKHIGAIRKALSLKHIGCRISSWKTPKATTAGAQIDLLIDRDDGCIHICEIKYSQNAFAIDKAYAKNLMNKLSQFDQVAPQKQTLLTLISPKGLQPNAWSEGLIDQALSLEDLLA